MNKRLVLLLFANCADDEIQHYWGSGNTGNNVLTTLNIQWRFVSPMVGKCTDVLGLKQSRKHNCVVWYIPQCNTAIVRILEMLALFFIALHLRTAFTSVRMCTKGHLEFVFTLLVSSLCSPVLKSHSLQVSI